MNWILPAVAFAALLLLWLWILPRLGVPT